MPKKNLQLFSLDQIINKTFDLVKNNLALDQMYYSNFQSSENTKIIRSSVNETFNPVKKATFDLVKFDLPTPSQKKYISPFFWINIVINMKAKNGTNLNKFYKKTRNQSEGKSLHKTLILSDRKKCSWPFSCFPKFIQNTTFSSVL